MLSLLAVVFLLFISPSWSLETGPYPGQQAPDLLLPTLEGNRARLSDLYAKSSVWMTLYTTWCPECNTETPLLVATSKANPEIQFISISLMEDVSDVEAFRRKFQVSYPMMVDPEGAAVDAYKIRPIPVNIGIAKGGEIVFRRPTVTQEEIPGLIANLEAKGASFVPAATAGRWLSLIHI